MKPLAILTAKQLKTLDEINRDKEAIAITLKVALQFHSNSLNDLAKTEKEWWLEMAKIHGLVLEDSKYKTTKVDGAVCIVNVADE